MRSTCAPRGPIPPALCLLAVALLLPGAAAGSSAAAADGTEAAAAAEAPGAAVYCPVCGARNRADSRFCMKDGTPLPPLDLSQRVPGFIRAPGTYSADEIRQVMDRIALSVVRIRVRTTTTFKYPVVYWKDRISEYFHRAMLGKIETSDSEARLAGSGFVVTDAGGILTNAHVAQPDGMRAELVVETGDGRTFPATLLGADAASDLALLKIDGGNLPPLAWGDSSAIRVGQEAWAFGNPLDIGLSITRGTIAGLVGTRVGINQVEAFLHSDAHITHGNSGGPLVDVEGRVLGVNAIKLTEEKGQGYAIPARMAQLVAERLRRDGHYDRGFVGLHVRPIDSESARRFSLKRTTGSVVESVLPGTPAAMADIQPGDVVFGINGREAISTYILQEAIASVGPAVAVRLMIDRQGQVHEIPLSTARRPAAPRIDPVADMEGYLRVRFEQDPRKPWVVIRDPNRSHRAPGLYEGARIKTVLPAQDWPEEPVNLNYYRTRARPAPIDSLDDLRAILKRAYVGGRMAATFEIDNPANPIASVAFDEMWPIIL